MNNSTLKTPMKPLLKKPISLFRTIHPNLRHTPLIFFLVINSLFLLKYGARITDYHWIFPSMYVCFVMLVLLIIKLVSQKVTLTPVLFFGSLCAFFLIIYFITLRIIDPITVNVDRWSAITSFNEHLLAGNFPYTARTHLGHQVSRFPCLFILALPFQLIGDVGYLQLFTFLCFSLIIYRHTIPPSLKLATLFLAGTSPIFLIEVAARSELFSNMVFILLLITAYEHVRNTKHPLHMVLCGMCSGLVLSTRGIVLVPFLVYISGYFTKNELRSAVTFFILLIITFSLTFLPFYLWDTEAFNVSNPFLLQSSYIPKFLLSVVVITSLGVGRYMKRIDQALLAAGYILCVTIGIIFLLAAFEHGWTQAVYQSYFYLTYFQFCMPFLLMR